MSYSFQNKNSNASVTVGEMNQVVNGVERPYRVYTALLTQSGEDAPVATVLENTLGDIWFEYNISGVYTINSNSLFTDNKTFFLSQITYANTPDVINIVMYIQNQNSISLQTILSGYANQDNLLSNTPIEIRVYN